MNGYGNDYGWDYSPTSRGWDAADDEREWDEGDDR